MDYMKDDNSKNSFLIFELFKIYSTSDRIFIIIIKLFQSRPNILRIFV